ncbi:hypothetical protein ASG40_18650 [Methylobacterium sp. Leaf399]|uniref:hypothetical protein n=1 Tax=unclassified Methylobacterium TaxID=2615210 RepID=UPI0006F4FE73|nr:MULTISPECIES: hypothetical protein [unclassified Methylobacterium]KQP48926.1 hypothetical protein ASF39_14295 [Methylobacterium sp. Leaf108]KQT15598.1 hypothetical protein ASG40_18650 [Methylobacterium sp. Leaf399]KQT83358.1 hypothetical protein ASG59_18155 [Methylobacterium sp. Leaf466]
MSSGLFQNLPGAHEMGGVNGLPSEPWLLPISDGPAPVEPAAEAVMLSVRRAARPFQMAANALVAALVLMLGVQIATDWAGTRSVPRSSERIADATPPTLPVEKAALTVHN